MAMVAGNAPDAGSSPAVLGALTEMVGASFVFCDFNAERIGVDGMVRIGNTDIKRL